MRPIQHLLPLILTTPIAAATVYLMVGPGSELANRPLALIGVGLIGLGALRHARSRELTG